jgi:RNA polymerase sigma factor (sigma-70 family)
MTAEQILDQCGPLILSLAGRAARIFREDRDDWAQDLRLEVLRFARTYDPARGAVTTWLNLRWRRLIGLRRRPDLRANRRLRTLAPCSLAFASAVDHRHADPADIAARSDSCRAFRERLAEIPRRERLVLVAKFEHGLTNEQSAATIGVSKARVWQLQRAGLEHLRERLEAA